VQHTFKLFLSVFLFLVSSTCFPQATAPANPANSAEDPNRAKEVLQALAAAYPDLIGDVRYLPAANGKPADWSLLLRGVRFYYAKGCLLPDNLRLQADDYSPLPFYNYSGKLPPWQDPSPEEEARWKQYSQNRLGGKPIKRSSIFLDTLWHSSSRATSYEMQKTIMFLGRKTLVHYYIMEELALVETRIRKIAETNPEVSAWLKAVSTTTSWNWRDIAATQSRSYHSYGVALDILPKSIQGKQTYWLWTAEKNPRWWAVPYKERYTPPQEVIDAFAAYGFIWGGVWPVYDTMHFEYRPELLILSGHTINKF
jgi:hypothetical protein